ncbi:MAG: ATP-binding cassette domain-containing protein [Candidatus Asgardarchaeia archaeon]
MMNVSHISSLFEKKGFPVSAKGLVKIYKTGPIEVVALRNLNIAIEAGEMRAIVGASGSGKTTFLNLVGGIDRPSAGKLFVGDIDVPNLPENKLVDYRRNVVGFVFQFFNLIPTLTALENVELPMIIANKFKGQRKERAMKLLELVGLSGRANHKPGELSGGEQQRVAIAAALANDPAVILADEPTGELDTKTSREIVNLFRKIVDETKKTMIIVTHDVSVAMSADKISRIQDGEIISTITPAEMEPVEVHPHAGREQIIQSLKQRLAKIEEEIQKLDESYRAGKIDIDTFTTRYAELKKRKEELESELAKYTLI